MRQPDAASDRISAALLIRLQLVLLDLLVERRGRDAELLGGLGLVAAALLERLGDGVALDALERLARQRQLLHRRISSSRLEEHEVPRLDLIAIGLDDRRRA